MALSSSPEFAPWLGVFETLRVVTGKPLFFAEHRTELTRAMTRLGLTTEIDFAAEGTRLPTKSGRWRWIVTRNETRTMFSEEPTPPNEPIALAVSPVRVGSENWDARFKTLSYLAHVQASKMSPTPEVILLNERGNVASAAHANVFWRKDGKLFTPAHEAGCRLGVTRGFVLQQESVEQGHFPLAELMGADEIFLTNSMKGIVSVNRIVNRSFEQFPHAEALRADYASEIAMRMQNRLPMQHW